MPPPSEQRAIIAHLEDETGKPNRAIQQTRREIDLLAEHKTRLTAAVVTGQIDVRASAAALPEAPEADLPE
ncbi:MAG: hypothetical protein LBI84_02700 [Propionibacteriaceae bacterium]|nr:hypothetical protein [Propionibacteriaceae bacterium]